MSLLDPLVRGTEQDLAPLQAAIDAVEAINGAQQTQLDGLAAQLDGFGDAQSAIDTLQNAAIDAAEAVNTAQSAAQAAMQAAQDAAATVDATHSADITALQTTVGSHTTSIGTLTTTLGTQATQLATQQGSIDALIAAQPNLATLSTVDLRMFVPGRVLTDGNIDDAIDAAIAYAMSQTGPGFKGPAPIIRCPAGKWTLTRTHTFAGFPGEANRCVIGFRGESMNETIFLLTSALAGAPVFIFGNASTPGPDPWTQYLRVHGFSIVGTDEENTHASGIRVYCAVKPIITDVRVRGLNSASCTYEQGRGLEVLPALGAGVPINSQFMVARDCDFSINMTGVYVETSYPFLFDNVFAEGNHFQNAVFSACMGEWRNSGAQFGGTGAYPDRWYGNRNTPGIVTGFSKAFGSAISGASIAVAVGTLTLVTLPGASLTQYDRSRWVRLTPAGSSANEIKSRGMYKIDSIASATTAWIRKGSNHTAQGSLTAQLFECAGGTELTFDNLYDEGHRIASYGFYRDNVGGGAYVVRRPLAFIASGGFIVESDGPARVRLEAPPAANLENVARVWMTKESFIDGPPSRNQVDDYSHPGHASRSAWQRTLAGTIPSDDRFPYAYRDAGGGSAVRVRTALQEMGFLEVWDARATSSINIVSSDARTWTGLLKGTVLSPTTAGLYPLYTPDDPLFGGPCVTMVAGTHLTGRSFKGAIAAANLPTHRYSCTIFTIARMESAAAPPGSELCRVQVGTADYNQFIAFNDALWTSGVYGMNEGTGIGNALTPFTPAIDTDPHAYVFGRSPDSTNFVSSDNGEDYRGHSSHTGGFTASHTIGANLDVVVGGVGATYLHRAFRVALVAVKIGTLSQAEARKLIDLSRNEWPLEA
jgi:hypothetical protein